MKGLVLFQRKIITKKRKYIDKILKIFFSRTTVPISSKFGTKHYWVKGIQVCWKEGPRPIPRGDNYKLGKICWQNLKIFSRTIVPNLIKLGTKHPWVKGIKVCSGKEPSNSQEHNVFFLLIKVIISWFELFSQVSDVAHRPLVL